MGSPITFSGFNSIDFSQVLNLVMEQERVPLNALKAQKQTLETQNTTFGTFLTKLTSLETAVKDLATADSTAKLSAVSSDAGVGVSTASGTVEGSYDIVVSQLARSQVTASSSTYASIDAVVATSGTLSLTVAGQPPVAITVAASTTLKQLADAINAKTDAPVTASVVQAAPGSYRLVLTGKTTGAANAFTMTSTLTGGSGLAFTDTNLNGIFGEAVDANAQQAVNASLTVNSMAITSASNTLTAVVPGVTLTLTREDATKTVNVKVQRDTAEVGRLLDKFVTAYNDVTGFMKDQRSAAATGNSSIGRDPILLSLREALRTELLGQYPDGGTYDRMALVGFSYDSTGKLKLDKTALEKALKDAPTSVQKLLSGVDGTAGVFGAVKTTIAGYTSSGGFVATVRQRLGDQASSMSKRLDVMEAQLAVRRAALQRQFTAADLAMTQMKNQSSSLSAIGGEYRLF